MKYAQLFSLLLITLTLGACQSTVMTPEKMAAHERIFFGKVILVDQDAVEDTPELVQKLGIKTDRPQIFSDEYFGNKMRLCFADDRDQKICANWMDIFYLRPEKHVRHANNRFITPHEFFSINSDSKTLRLTTIELGNENNGYVYTFKKPPQIKLTADLRRVYLGDLVLVLGTNPHVSYTVPMLKTINNIDASVDQYAKAAQLTGKAQFAGVFFPFSPPLYDVRTKDKTIKMQYPAPLKR